MFTTKGTEKYLNANVNVVANSLKHEYIQIREIYKHFTTNRALIRCLPRVKQRPIFISFFFLWLNQSYKVG